MEDKELLGSLKKEKDYYEQKTLKCNPGYAQTLPRVIDLIESYTNSRFRNNDYDASGWRKPFYNIVENPWLVAAKMIDLDTKNVQVIAEEGHSQHISHLFDKELKFYMKTKKFGKLLNEGTYNLPKYGHLAVKKVMEDIYNVYPGNLMYDPEADSILKSSFLIERHWYSPSELEKMPWDKAKIKEIVEEARKLEKKRLEVFERYSDDGFSVIGGSDIGKQKILAKGTQKPEYKEVKFEHIQGRALGRGQVERLFEPQIIQNESLGYLLKGLKWSSMHVFQSRDEQVKKNFLSDVEDGEIMTANSEILPVAMEERNLGAFRYIDTLLAQSIQTRSFSQDIIRGDRPPSGTPLGTSQLQAMMASGFFDLKREDLGMFWKDVIEDWIIPDFKKKNRKAHQMHILKLLGDDSGSEKYFNAILDHRTNIETMNQAQKGHIMSGAEIEVAKAVMADSVRNMDMNLMEGIYDDFKYKIDVVITGEQIDLSSKITTLQVLLQLLFSNPMALQDNVIKRTVFKLMDWAGINPDEIMDLNTPSIQNMGAPMQQGGSVSMPRSQVQPQMANKSVTL